MSDSDVKSALKSRDIKDYRTANIEDLKIDRALPCDIYLYFAGNNHIMLWQVKDYTFAPGAFESYLAKGLKKVWVHITDVEAFSGYLAPAIMDPAPAEETTAPVDDGSEPDQEINARYLYTVLRSAIYNDRQKRALIAKAVRTLLGQAATADSLRNQAGHNFNLQNIVRELIGKITVEDTASIHQVVQQIWSFSHTHPELDHAVNVATFSVLVAMSFGMINEELITEIGIAALFHDIGISQLPLDIAHQPWMEMSMEQNSIYSQHVPFALDLLFEFVSELPPRVSALIEQSHENYDGTGYPHRKKGFQIDASAQIISMADVLETISSGLWDGQKRTLTESIAFLEAHEKQAAVEGSHLDLHYKPEIFAAITRWIHEAGSDKAAA